MKQYFTIKAGGQLTGEIPIPGDKSISHRSVMLASIAQGRSRITGLLCSDDVICTIQAMKTLGVRFEKDGEDKLLVYGNQLNARADTPIDLGNSGTAMRLLAGLLGGLGIECELHGDQSLNKRPMARIIKPLQQMNINIQGKVDTDTPPLILKPHTGTKGISYALPLASAQVKSCLLLAGLNSSGDTIITEPTPSRNHTELMLQNFGVNIQVKQNQIYMAGQQKLIACNQLVPSDISSAAFFMVAASVTPNSDITIRNIGTNPTRNGVISLLKKMGANIRVFNKRFNGSEPIADIQVKYAPLTGITFDEDLIPLAIDEFPILFVAAACAKGKSSLRNANELRHKESDRIYVMAKALKQCGITAVEFDDGIDIIGGQLQAPEREIDSQHDHRIAMALTVAATAMQSGEINLTGCDTVETSFPDFFRIANHAGINCSLKN